MKITYPGGLAAPPDPSCLSAKSPPHPGPAPRTEGWCILSKGKEGPGVEVGPPGEVIFIFGFCHIVAFVLYDKIHKQETKTGH